MYIECACMSLMSISFTKYSDKYRVSNGPGTISSRTKMPDTSGFCWNYITVDSGYQAHALFGTIAKIYALHNEVR